MTIENISFYHLTTREGYQKLTYELSDTKSVDYVTTSFIQKNILFTVKVESIESEIPISDIRIGFLHDFSVDESRNTQMDEFCLRPVESSCLRHNAHIFSLRNNANIPTDPILYDSDSEKTYALGAEEIYNTFNESICYSVRINDEKYCVLSQSCKIAYPSVSQKIEKKIKFVCPYNN